MKRGTALRRRPRRKDEVFELSHGKKDSLLREHTEAWNRLLALSQCGACGGAAFTGSGGVIDGHHVVPKQTLKRWAATNRLDEQATLRLVWDERNRLPLCRRCHDRHESGHTRVRRSLLPASAEAFARELGLEHVLERLYPEG